MTYFSEEADNRIEMMLEENQDMMNQIEREEREDYARYSD